MNMAPTSRASARASLLLIVLLTIAGCSRGRIYAVPVEDVRRTLEQVEFPVELFGADRVRSDVLAASPSDVIWTISQEGHPVLRFRAKLTPKGAGSTRIAVEVEGANPKAVQMLKERPAMGRLEVAAMEERIAAAIEQRPFDLTRTYPEMSLALIAERPRMLEDARAVAAASSARDAANIERAYAEEAAGR